MNLLRAGPLGLAVRKGREDNPYTQTVGVIGAVEPGTQPGNVTLRVGKRIADSEGTGWEQTTVVTLTPDEREHLIDLLVATR
jgi:hypothetical protein